MKDKGVTKEPTSKLKTVHDTSGTCPPRSGLLFSHTEFILMMLLLLPVVSTTSNKPAPKCKPPSLCPLQRRLPLESWSPDWTACANSADNPYVAKATSTLTNKYHIHLLHHYSIPSSEINGLSKPQSWKVRDSGAEYSAWFLSLRALSAWYLQLQTGILGPWAPHLAGGPWTTYWASLNFKYLACERESEDRRFLPTFTFHVFKKECYRQKMLFLHGKIGWV